MGQLVPTVFILGKPTLLDRQARLRIRPYFSINLAEEHSFLRPLISWKTKISTHCSSSGEVPSAPKQNPMLSPKLLILHQTSLHTNLLFFLKLVMHIVIRTARALISPGMNSFSQFKTSEGPPKIDFELSRARKSMESKNILSISQLQKTKPEVANAPSRTL